MRESLRAGGVARERDEAGALSMNLTYWTRWLGLATLLGALIGLGLSFIPATQTAAVALVYLVNQVALAVAALGIAACWRRWRWVIALALAGLATLLIGPVSHLLNSNLPFVIMPIIVGALGLLATGLLGVIGAWRASPSNTRSR